MDLLFSIALGMIGVGIGLLVILFFVVVRQLNKAEDRLRYCESILREIESPQHLESYLEQHPQAEAEDYFAVIAREPFVK